MAENLSRLKGSKKVRERAGVNLASDDIKGTQQTFFEIVSNSIDRFKKGYGNKIIINKYQDLSYSIEDFADGLPIEWNEDEQAYNWDIALKVLYGGENYDSNNRQNGELGYNGLGLTSTQYSSEYMNVKVTKNGYDYELNFKEGRPVDINTGEFLCEDTDDTLDKELGLRVFSKVKSTKSNSGTFIKYKPDIRVFTDIDISHEWICNKLRKQAVVNNGLTIIFNDFCQDKTETFYYETISNYIKEISNEENICDIIEFSGSGEGQDIKTKPIYTVSFNFSFAFNNRIKVFEHYHNSSELSDRKSVTSIAIESAFTSVFNEFCETNSLLTKGEKKLKFIDIEDSLICVLSSKSSYTSYANQTKLSIDNRFIKEFLTSSIKEKLSIYFIENPTIAKSILNQILINKRSREKAESLRISTKSKLENEVKFTDIIKNYKPCQLTDKNIVELYLNEGSSALGGMLKSRNSLFQAGFHVGGKMKSLLKAQEKSIFSNEVVNNLYKILGCGTILSKSKFNKEKLPPYNFENLNWNKIIISTDQDIDAYQIRCLILTCLYVMSPDLIEKGVVYIAEAPLFEITTKEKEERVLFAYTENEKNKILEELDSQNIKYRTPERNKGLGEMDKFSMSRAIMQPETRRITKVTVADVKKMIETFETWLGEDISDRRDIIVNNFNYVEKFEDKKEKDIVEVLNENYLPYAIDVIKNRAIISIDGFKPAHRKLLWTLHEKGLYNKKRTKSANIVGDNMSLNVHGDGSIYQTLVRMAQEDTLLYPYVNGKGNFGQHTSKDLEEAHMRYTEAGASEINKEFFQDINKNAVDLVPNFDGQKKEPSLLPTTFPNVLVNYNSGIAVGMASSTPSFPLDEVCDTTINYIKDKSINISDYLIAPDFATAGYLIYDKEALEEIYNTGSGSVTLRARYKVDGNKIIITEIPYTTSIEAIVDTIKDFCKRGDDNYKCITKILDSTELKGMSITIETKKNTDIEKLMNILYRQTPLEAKQSFNMNILCLDEIPRVMSIKQILDEWLKFREQCILRVLNYDLDNKSKELHLLNGLAKILLDLDKTIEIIKNSKGVDVIKNLCSYFDIDEIQATEVVNMKFININKDYILQQTQKITTLNNEVSDIKLKITKVDEIIISDLERVKKKYAQPRKTEIIQKHEVQEISKEDLIEDNAVTLVLTKENYLKKNLKYSTSQNVKDNDEVIQLHQTSNKTDLLLFTDKGRLFIRKTYDIKEKQPSQIGDFIPNLIDDLQKDEKVIYIHTTKDWSENLICVFENGNISKMNLSKTRPIQNRKVAIEKIFNLESPLVSIIVSKQDLDMLLVNQSGHGLILNSSTVNAITSKNGKGNSGISLDTENMPDDKVIHVINNVVVDTSFHLQTEKGKDLYILLNDVCPANDNKNMYTHLYSKTRGRKGNFIYNTRQKNDKIISLKQHI